MDNLDLKGEIWEIQGLLYIIAGRVVNAGWISNLMICYGVFSIIMGILHQRGYHTQKSAKEQIK